MTFFLKKRNTGWYIGGAIVALMMVLLAESSVPLRYGGVTPGTNTTNIQHKDFRPILQNIKTIPEHLIEEKKPQTLAAKRLSGAPEPANGPMAILSRMKEAHTIYLDQLDISIIEIPAAWDADWLLEIVQEDPSVDYADVDRGKYILPQANSPVIRPNDPDFGHQTNLHDPVRDVDIDAPEAWAYTTGSDSVVVAVLDRGIDITNPDLLPNLWVNSSETAGNNIDDDMNGCVDDIHGCNLDSQNGMIRDLVNSVRHGTAVSSVLGARGGDSHGMTGVAWNIRMMTLVGRFLSVYNHVLKMQRRDVNVRVINHGGIAIDDCNPDDPSSLFGMERMEYDTIRQLGEAGILVVAPMGNERINFDDRDGNDQPDNPYMLYRPHCYRLNNIINVAGQSETARTRWEGSNYGSVAADLFAPAENVWGYSPIYPSGRGPVDGTSFAAPQVSAAAALLWSFKPDLTVSEVRSALLNTIDRFPAFDGQVATGGALNIANALYSVAEPGIRIHSSQTAIAEGNAGYLDLSLTREPVRPSSGEVVVLQGTAITSPTAVAAVTPSTLTFTSANWHIPQRMTVRAAGARGSEVRLQVTVDNARSTTDYRTLPMQTATLTVQSDGIRPTLQLPRSIAEGDTATAIIRFSDPLINAAQFTITATGDGTAVEGTDYTLPNTITATTDSASATFNIPTVANPGYNGPDKTIHLQITTENPLISPQTLQATLTIEDSDTPIMTITVLPGVISQSNIAATAQTATATIALDREAVEDVTFYLNADQRRGHSLDHLMNHLSGNDWPTSATIVTGGTSTNIIIHSIDEDDDPGPTYRIRLSLSLPEGAAARLGTPSQATLITRDDDGSSDLYLRLRVFLEGAMSTETITRQIPDP